LAMHISDYYLTVPSIGLAMLAAWAASTARSWPRAAAALALVPWFMFCSISQAHSIELDRFQRGRTMRHFLRDMQLHESEYEDKIVLLQSVNEDLFWGGLLDRPLRLIGIPNVYLSPGGAGPSWIHGEYADVSNYEISWQDAYDLVAHNRAVVFSVASHPVNITADFAKGLAVEQALRAADIVNVADASASARLGDGWYPVEGSTRWTGRDASLWMESYRPKQRLYIRGYCPEPTLLAGPLELRVEVDGQPIANFLITRSNWFTVDAPLPPEVSGKGKVNVHLRVSRVYRPPNDARDLGLIFATFTVQAPTVQAPTQE
jgi:hypothetical protein